MVSKICQVILLYKTCISENLCYTNKVRFCTLQERDKILRRKKQWQYLHVIQDIPLSRYQEVSSLIEEDIYQALESQTAVQKRDSLGGTGFTQIRQELERAKKQLEKE